MYIKQEQITTVDNIIAECERALSDSLTVDVQFYEELLAEAQTKKQQGFTHFIRPIDEVIYEEM